jgi:heptosyltransferase I
MHASMTANLVSCLVKATRKIGFDKNRARDLQRLFCNETIATKPRQHVMDGLFGFAEHLGVGSEKLQWDLMIPESAIAFANNHIQKGKINCVISPCSSQRFGATYNRSWPMDNYLSVIDHLIKTYDMQIILTGGATEIELSYGKKISQHFKGRVKNLINQTSIKELVALIDQADFVLCPDSGPAHIATAMNTSVIGLYAMSNPLRSGPFCSQDLVINAYPKAAQKFLNKEISELKWGYRIKEPEAMNLITSKEVIKKIDQLIL